MSYQEISILSDNLKASSRGKAIEKPYRAMLVQDDETMHHLVVILQKVKDKWSVCGTWRLTTLLFSYPMNLDTRVSDGLSLDFGAQWKIDSGMREALLVALELI